jgi:septal ring factor EnvC (AmiA/AmiB activator)
MPMEDVEKPQQVARKWLLLSLIANVLLLVLAGGSVLFAFMLSYDLQKAKIAIDKEKQDRQRVEAYLAESRARAAEVEREIRRLSQALNAKDPAQIESSKPDLPVQVSFRRSYLGIGLVAKIKNASTHYLTLVMTTRNPTLSTAKRFQIEIKPGDEVDFGHDDGWKFTSGDELALYNDNYQALKVTVP